MTATTEEDALGSPGRVEGGLQSFIEVRDAERRAAGEAPAAEVLERHRREREERRREEARRENRWRWAWHFERMAARHRALAADCERRADALVEEAAGGGGR